jgi:RNA polymerase primary sigma factor
VREARAAITGPTISLNEPLGPREDASKLEELIEDERASETADEVMAEMERASFKEAIEGLPERHRYVLIRRYGLDDREPATLAELHDELKMSRERVRQIQREAERMLKKQMLNTSGASVRRTYLIALFEVSDC